MDILSLLFPKRCVGCKRIGAYICSLCFARIAFTSFDICLVCGKGAVDGLTHPVCKKPTSIDGAWASLVYVGIVKKLVYTFKYKPYVSDLRETLGELFYEGIIQKEGFAHLSLEQAVLVPIPLSRKKQKQRGYNQSRLLAEDLGKRLGLPVIDLLLRQKETAPQFGLKREERVSNIHDAFGLKSDNICYPTILLVDDLCTSGTTMNEAAKLLKKAKVVKNVYGLSLAHGL